MNSDRQTNKTLVAQLSQRISGKDDYSWSSSGNSRSTRKTSCQWRGHLLLRFFSLSSSLSLASFLWLPPSISFCSQTVGYISTWKWRGRRRPLAVSYSSSLFPWRSCASWALSSFRSVWSAVVLNAFFELDYFKKASRDAYEKYQRKKFLMVERPPFSDVGHLIKHIYL